MNPNEVRSEQFSENALTFVRCLRGAGLPISSGQVMDFVQALALVNIGQREQVYHAAACTLVSRHEHLRLFETIFNLMWKVQGKTPRAGAKKAPRAPRHDHDHKPVLFTYMASKAMPTDVERDVTDRAGTFSALEILQRKDFSEMSPDELDAVKRLILEMRWKPCFRRTRRYVASRGGEILHMRRVMASAAKHGGVPLALAWQSRKVKQRPIVLIADISGSMEKYSRLVLQFFYSVSHSLKHVECFVFGTRLTRITLPLKLRNIDRAVNDAAAEIVDWAGGTRIGDSLATFNHEWARRVLHRGAVVVVVSDGWDRGDALHLAEQMRYLRLRCYRLIWLNPLAGKGTYQPLVQGIAAALPYIDDFLPIHNLQSLSTLAAHLATLNA